MHPADRTERAAARSAGAFILAASLMLVACDAAPQGGLSEGEEQALEEAAEKLDRQQLPEGAIPPVDVPVAEQAPQDDRPQTAERE